MAKRKGLGKGLDALFADNSIESGDITTLPINSIEPNRDQPRREFDEQALDELADSISRHGVVTPLLVRPLPDGLYQIVAGERRWRAARQAELNDVPVVIRDLSDREVMEIALIENLQREDLNPIEEAQGYQKLIETYGLTQEEVAQSVGKSRPAVANALRLIGLPEKILKLISEGKLSAGHGRTLLSLQSTQKMEEFADLVIKQGISVRELERMCARANKATQLRLPKIPPKYVAEAELSLNESFGREVKITPRGEGGIISIPYFGKEDLEKLLKSFD